MDLGNFAPFALLTGAGFSCNWDGLPANQIWDKIYADLIDSATIKNVLDASPGDYEGALHRARTDCPPDDYRRFEAAVVDVFRVQEERIVAASQNLNEYAVRMFLSMFGRGPTAQNWHAGYQTGYIFTLNQDWLVERLWNGGRHTGYFQAASVPGIPVWTERGYLDYQRDPFNVAGIRVVPDPRRWPPVLTENQNYIKLHGSFEWRTDSGTNVLVMGGGKAEQIESFPILQHFFAIFREVCARADLRLMIIGYSFGDPHVNSIIAEACRKRSERPWIFVIDVKSQSEILAHLRSGKDPNGPTIADAIFGWSREPLTAIFRPPGGPANLTPEYRRIFRQFFGPTLPG